MSETKKAINKAIRRIKKLERQWKEAEQEARRNPDSPSTPLIYRRVWDATACSARVSGYSDAIEILESLKR